MGKFWLRISQEVIVRTSVGLWSAAVVAGVEPSVPKMAHSGG